jgi:O-antigen ligase
MATMAPFALIAVAVILPQTPAGSKLLASIGIEVADNSLRQAALGTQHARAVTWRRVIDYTGESPMREATGVGFGPHFMIASRASVALLGSDAEDVRSPHNYLVGTYARLGLIGCALLGVVIVAMLAAIWRIRHIAAGDDLLMLAMVIPPMILVAACFGVVLEAPFGAIPFFWFLGILLCQPSTYDSSKDRRGEAVDRSAYRSAISS